MLARKRAQEVSQYGITWKFDKPHTVGKFVTGDWWVVGPVSVVSVTPMPVEGPLDGEVDIKQLVKEDVKDIKGRMQFIMGWIPPEIAGSSGDKRMRNGSMVIEQFGTKQGFDSRSNSYDPSSSITFPYKLDINRTLVSTISLPAPLAECFCHKIMWGTEKKQRTLLRTAAVLTCVGSEPPPDAFRPPYAGTDKPIYQAKNLKWDLLSNLKLEDMDKYFQRPWLNPADPKCEVAAWEDFEGYFQRPWLSHYSTKDFGPVLAYMQPSENQPASATACFGREDARLVSIASLMLHLDVTKERKTKLLIGMVQRGIDLSGLFKVGIEGSASRFTWIQSGCKWPILFASLMLDEPALRQVPEGTPFHEDITTYFGTGWFGQTALWRIVWHDHLIASCEERSPEQRIPDDGISENYRSYGSSGKAWLGMALSARLMKAVKIWGHDAFFEYCDRWMEEDESVTDARGLHDRPVWETKTWEPFVDAMWRAFRKSAPEQEQSAKNFKAAWERKEDGWHIQWTANSKPDANEVAEHLAAIHKAFPQWYPTPEMRAERKAAMAKAHEECVAQTKVREAEAKAKPAPANTVNVIAATDFSGEGGGNVKVTDSKSGAVGKILWGWDSPDHWLEWNFDLPTEGYYYLTLCYCSGLDKIEREIKVNGEDQEPFAPMVFPSTGGFANGSDDWRLFTAQNPTTAQPLLLKFKQGKNVVRLTNSNGRGINVHYLARNQSGRHSDTRDAREQVGKIKLRCNERRMRRGEFHARKISK